MRYAIISDIHSNLEALTAVMANIDRDPVDEIACLGDLIGYGASPKPCIDLVRSKCKKVVIGNHDHAVIGLTNKEYFNPNAKQAVEWTAKKLSKPDFDFFASLPMTIRENKIIFTHASLHKPSEWGYILDEYEAEECFRIMDDAFITFIGHSHIPLAFEYGPGPYVKFLGFFNHLTLNPSCRYIINVGSVGQPRDGINQASYVLYDSEKFSIDLVRTAYDIKTAQKKILEAGLPEFLAERIQYGR